VGARGAPGQVGGESDEASEPEDHGDGLNGDDGKPVDGNGEDDRGTDQVGQHQPGPHGAEDEEGDLGRGAAQEGLVEFVCDCGSVSVFLFFSLSFDLAGC
jgi:hypothetical protein